MEIRRLEPGDLDSPADMDEQPTSPIASQEAAPTTEAAGDTIMSDAATVGQEGHAGNAKVEDLAVAAAEARKVADEVAEKVRREENLAAATAAAKKAADEEAEMVKKGKELAAAAVAKKADDEAVGTQAARAATTSSSRLPRPPMPSVGPHGQKFTFEKKPPSFERFAVQRADYQCLDPGEILREQLTPGFELPGGDFATEFSYMPEGDTRDEQLWRWWRDRLPRCGVFPDMVYWGTVHERHINAWAYQGSSPVPAVATKLGPSINWHITKPDGRIRADGQPASCDVLVKMLRWGFEPRNSSVMAAAQKATRAHLHNYDPNRSMDDLRAAWAETHKHEILAIGRSMIVDGMGEAGIWDKLQKAVGTKGAPMDNSRPWVIFTVPRVTVLVHKNGKVGLQIGSTTPKAADKVAKVLVEEAGGQARREVAIPARTRSARTRPRLALPASPRACVLESVRSSMRGSPRAGDARGFAHRPELG